MKNKILIIGNGFDLAHDLPTKYSDFIEFSDRMLKIYNSQCNDMYNYTNELVTNWKAQKKEDEKRLQFLKYYLMKYVESREEKNVNEELLCPNEIEKWNVFNDFLSENILYDYFQKIYSDNLIKGENWIDFESELSYVISYIDNHSSSIGHRAYDIFDNIFLEDSKISIFYNILNSAKYINRNWDMSNSSIRELRDLLFDDLKNIIFAFDIYLEQVVSKIDIKKKIPFIRDLRFDYVISFNYTKTYENFYVSEKNNPTICYIHGSINGKIDDDNNMVLGVDEYLSDGKENERTDFSIFKKFVQRIRNHNDVIYSLWIDEIEKEGSIIKQQSDKVFNQDKIDTSHISEVYILGHSLDVTDKDILKKFIVSDFTRIHILTRNKASEGSLISNLIRIGGQKEIIRKSSSCPPLILFEDYNKIPAVRKVVI